MRRVTGASLSALIVRSMMAIALGVSVLVLLTSYGFYFVLTTYWPESDTGSWVPTTVEWMWMAITTLVALALAAYVAIRLSRRILVPLNSLADGLRRLAQGELNVRAVPGPRSTGEAAELADHFNALVTKLQRMTQERTFWNAAIAHELRTPVTILRGRMQGLVEGVFQPDQEMFRLLLGQVEGLGRLIEDLRVVSLAESGHLSLQLQPTELALEVERVVAFFSEAFRAANQTPVLDVQPGRVLSDPIRIRQALLALLENASKHALPGQVRIEVRLECGRASLAVEDEGPGVAEDFAGHVFTAFRRKSSSRSSEGSSGSGLGLAVVAAIAHAHDGEAVCQPTARGGARFVLRWPIR